MKTSSCPFLLGPPATLQEELETEELEAENLCPPAVLNLNRTLNHNLFGADGD